MSPRRLLLRCAAGGCGALLLAATIACGAAVSAGTMRISIHKKGPGGAIVSLPVPVALAQIGLRLADDGELAEAARRLRPWSPLIHAALASLPDTPDAVLVEVIDDDDRVIIAKRGGALLIDVEDDEDAIHLSVPIDAVGSMLSTIEARAGSEDV
jgi:hypothetical protein